MLSYRRVVLYPLLLTFGCKGSDSTNQQKLPALQLMPMENPAPVGSAQPGLTMSSSGKLYVSWQEKAKDSSLALRFAVRTHTGGNAWSPTRTVATGLNMLVSATDVPTVHEEPSGRLIAAWRGKHSARGYDILLSHSLDRGVSWSVPRRPHRDVTTTEHGFVSWLQVGDTSGMIWVDGRHNEDADTATRRTQLAFAAFDKAGDPQVEQVVDNMICDCCHTSATAVPGGAVVAYRDRHDGDIRDISVVRVAHGEWQTPVSAHDDHWLYRGCPVNGPAIAARGAAVAVAWFTGARDTARVRVAFSRDTATTFGTPVEINESVPDGRVGVVMTPNGDAMVSWIERRGATAVLRIRRVSPTGAKSDALDVANLGEGKRAGGAPKLVLDGTDAVLAWTDLATNRVRTSRLVLR